MTTAFHIPSSADELQLIQWIGFCRKYGIELDKESAAIEEQEDSVLKQFNRAEHTIMRFFSLAAYFHGIEFDEAANRFTVNQVTDMYNNYFSKYVSTDEPIQLITEYNFNGSIWCLPPVEMLNDSLITFGEFIDSKVVMQNAKTANYTKWDMLLEIACIFFRPNGEKYNLHNVSETSERRQLLGTIPMSLTLVIGEWFEQFNNYLVKNFQVFSHSTLKGGRNLSKHFDTWGWINYLISIAKTKIFDIPNSGLNSIDCARLAPCYDVLMYSSQEKGYNEAVHADMLAENKKFR